MYLEHFWIILLKVDATYDSVKSQLDCIFYDELKLLIKL